MILQVELKVNLIKCYHFSPESAGKDSPPRHQDAKVAKKIFGGVAPLTPNHQDIFFLVKSLCLCALAVHH